MQQLRYEGPRLDDLLARVQADHGSAANILSAEKSRRGGVGGFFAREMFEVIVEVTADEAPHDAAMPDDAPPAESAAMTDGRSPEEHTSDAPAPTMLDVRESPDEFAALLSSLIAQDQPAAAVASAPTPVLPTPMPASAPAPTRAAPSPSPTFVAPVEHPPIRFDPPIDLRAEPVAPRHAAAPRPVATGPVTLDRLFDHAEAQVLPPPPLPHDGVVCVVGPKVEATRTAMVLARSIGQQLDEVVIVPSRTTDQLAPETVAVFVDELRRRNAARPDRRGPVIIVIELVAVLDGYQWVNHVLVMLHPNQIRLAGAARWVLREIDNVRAAVASPSVLDVWEIGDLSDPQRLLDTAVPVGSVDGAIATVAMWAAVLLAARHGAPAPTPAPHVVPSSPIPSSPAPSMVR